MKFLFALLFLHLSIVLSKPIETKQRDEQKFIDDKTILADATKDEKEASRHHFDAKHVESSNGVVESPDTSAIEEKQSDSLINDKLEKLEADRVEEKVKTVGIFLF